MRLGAVALLALVLSGCTVFRSRLHVFPRCADGLPPEILIDPACPPDGICGYSCLPGRWELGGASSGNTDSVSPYTWVLPSRRVTPKVKTTVSLGAVSTCPKGNEGWRWAP